MWILYSSSGQQLEFKVALFCNYTVIWRKRDSKAVLMAADGRRFTDITMWKQSDRYPATFKPLRLWAAALALWLSFRFPHKANLFACFADNRLQLFRLACTFEQRNAKVIWRWWISILSDWSWQAPSHQAHLDGQRAGGHFALIGWLRHRNGEEANDNGEEGGGVRGVQLGLIHQLSQLKQKRVQLASPIISWLLPHYRRWHTAFSLMAVHRGGGTTAIVVCLSPHHEV